MLLTLTLLFLLIAAVAAAYLSVRGRVVSTLEGRRSARRDAERQRARECRQREAYDQVMRQLHTRSAP